MAVFRHLRVMSALYLSRPTSSASNQAVSAPRRPSMAPAPPSQKLPSISNPVHDFQLCRRETHHPADSHQVLMEMRCCLKQKKNSGIWDRTTVLISREM